MIWDWGGCVDVVGPKMQLQHCAAPEWHWCDEGCTAATQEQQCGCGSATGLVDSFDEESKEATPGPQNWMGGSKVALESMEQLQTPLASIHFSEDSFAVWAPWGFRTVRACGGFLCDLGVVAKERVWRVLFTRCSRCEMPRCVRDGPTLRAVRAATLLASITSPMS